MRRTEFSDEELDVSSSVSYGLAKGGAASGGGAVPKNEEDRHRRTIIIERKNKSYGFTLQSYGIHYKKEQEVEMLTYVDHVEYDGPAYRAGMREGDVILSINGVDMEKAEHNTLVSFIKECDTRMRMVVLFEDCVRKVGLHMRYIHLQNVLQSKMTELEALLQREREILEGKWKTHSLPARKKANASANGEAVHQEDDVLAKFNGNEVGTVAERNGKSIMAAKTNTLPLMTRSAVSSENVGKFGSKHHQLDSFTPNAQVLLSYQYMDPKSRTNLMKSSNSSGIDSSGYLVGASSTEDNLNYYQVVNKSEPNIHIQQAAAPTHDSSNCSTLSKHGYQSRTQDEDSHCHSSRHSQYYSHLQENRTPPQQQCENNGSVKGKKTGNKHCRQSYYCNPCMGYNKKKMTPNAGGGGGGDKNNGDNVSLDAYDLASPCCDPHQCVPIRRRSRQNHHHHHHQAQQQQQLEQHVHQHQPQQQHLEQEPAIPHHHHHHHHEHNHQKHKHKHVQKEDQRPQRPKSQSNMPSNATVLMHQQQHNHQQSVQKSHARYYNLNCDMNSRCSLHSNNTASDAQNTSYCSTSLSADTLNDWSGEEDTGDARKPVKIVKCYDHNGEQYQAAANQPSHHMVTRFYHHTVQIQPAPDYQYQQNFMQKPKSWDNLAPKGVGGYGFGYGFVDNSGNAVLPPRNVKVHHHMPVAHPDTGNYGKIVQSQPACPNVVRKNVYQHYGTTGVPGAGQCVQAAGGTAVSTAATGLSGQYVSSTTTTIITATSAQTPASEGCSAKCVKSTIACDQGKGCK